MIQGAPPVGPRQCYLELNSPWCYCQRFEHPRIMTTEWPYLPRITQILMLPQGVKESASLPAAAGAEEGRYGRNLNGRTVAPKKPIIYYIDPAPRQMGALPDPGVNDWQKASKKPLKECHVARKPPAGRKQHLEPGRRPLFRPLFTNLPKYPMLQPHVHDPRSGEILESHINWYIM